MNRIYNDSLIVELKNLTANENVCPNMLITVCNNLKEKVFTMVDNEDLLKCLRYEKHLQSVLLFQKGIRSKKKRVVR